MKTAQAQKITEKVFWTGAMDWTIRNFHGYSTQRGTSYNAYLVIADKITLVDTVKYPFREELLSRISSVIPPEKIDYIISNHSEMDHSGALPYIIEKTRPEKVFVSVNGAKALRAHFGDIGPLVPVKTGDKISLGNMDVSFIETKMLHWPDSMFSYLHGEEILFSQDGFGMHLASSKLFDDENDYAILEQEAAKYYANILLPFSDLITKCVDLYKSLNLKVKYLAPDHGPVWRKHIGDILGLYEKWAQQKPQRRAVIIYDTMWNSTAMMADAIAEGLRVAGVPVRLYPMTASHRSDAVTEVMNSGAVFVGSPTMNNNIFPTIADILCYLKGLKPKNKIGAAFGSFGWSGESVPQLGEFMKGMGIELVSEGISVKYVPDESALLKCRDLGLEAGRRLNEKCG